MRNIFSGKSDVYIEVAERYERFIKLGVLANGDKLPSTRAAAGELGVNPNTVQKAYTLLEQKGLIRALPKKGAFVTYTPEAGAVEVVKDNGAIVRALTELKEQGYTKEEIAVTLDEIYKV